MKKVSFTEMRSLEAGAFGFYGRRRAAQRAVAGAAGIAALVAGVSVGFNLVAGFYASRYAFINNRYLHGEEEHFVKKAVGTEFQGGVGIVQSLEDLEIKAFPAGF